MSACDRSGIFSLYRKFSQKLPTIAPAEAATALAEVVIVSAEIAFAKIASAETATTPTVVLEIKGSHKYYLAIFS